MLKNIILLLTVLLTCSLLSTAKSFSVGMTEVKIICTSLERVRYAMEVGEVLECGSFDGPIISSSPGSRLSQVVHADGSLVENLSEIGSLNIVGSIVNFIPDGIHDMMPNLKVLTIISSDLMAVTRENLKQFGNSLELVQFSWNRLTSLDGNLFDFNSNLRAISFQGNVHIAHIGPEFFKNLVHMKYLSQVDLEICGCISQIFSIDNGVNIETFKWNNEKCFTTSLEQPRN